MMIFLLDDPGRLLNYSAATAYLMTYNNYFVMQGEPECFGAAVHSIVGN